MENNLKQWVHQVINQLPVFLENMKDTAIPGRFKYSMSGDVESTNKWGLGNSVFAVKTYYMLNKMDQVDINATVQFIKSFQSNKGEIFDPLVQKLSRPQRMFNALRSLDFNNLGGIQIRRAETRQSFAALKCMNQKPDKPYAIMPGSKKSIADFIHSLNWKTPWGAASHFSHLVFFINMNFELFQVYDEEETRELLDYAFKELEKYRQNDGAWYKKGATLPDYQKINGAMKVMTAYSASNRKDFENPEGLIDLCFSSLNDGNACNHFNIICVLYHCIQKTKYREHDAFKYCLKRLGLYKEYWWPEHGGFSFLPGRSNMKYYGASISKGLQEPDIHGTHLFLWGITLLTEILGWDDEIRLRFPVT